jgi:lysophospholipase L1-like esterase
VTRTLVIIASGTLAILAAEAVVRRIYAPIDFLRPTLVADEVLLHRVAPHSSGHDEWGFRNPRVPATADIVAIGDSTTYGYAATTPTSWPSWVARETGSTVYNLALGGFGPPDYLHLLETYATRLSPSVVIVGIFLGNDLEDTVSRVYSRERWRDLRRHDPPRTAPEHAAAAADGVRTWLQAHSMFYRLVESGPIGQTVNRVADAARAREAGECSLESGGRFPTEFTPFDRLRALDLTSPRIQEGLALTIELVDRMRDRTERAGARLIVLVIPTKESVFDGLIDGRADTACLDVVRRVVAYETQARTRITDELTRRGIAMVDVRPALAHAVAEDVERLFLRSADSHPNENGYRLIAAEIVKSLRAPSPPRTPGRP